LPPSESDGRSQFAFEILTGFDFVASENAGTDDTADNPFPE